jgi:O-antigen/teichoic acid export membrane protein
MGLRAQVSNGLKWQIINIAGKQLLSLVVFTTLARLLEPAAFGLVALIGVYTYFASMLADLGIGVALVQRKTLEKAHLDTAFWFNVSCNAALCVATMALAGPISTMMGEPKLTNLLRWSSLGLMFGAVSTVQCTLFTKELDFRRPTLRALIGNGFGGVVGIAMAVSGCGVWSLVGQLLAGALAGAVFIWIASTYRPSLAFSSRHLRELLKVGSSVFANSLIWFFSSRLDQLVIGRFAGVPALGLYVIAGKVPEMARTASQQPIVDVSVPALARLQDEHPKMCQAIYRGMELNALVLFAVFVGIAVVSKQLVPFLFGAKWEPAAPLCSLLSLYALLNGIQVFAYPALLASGVTGQYVLFNVVQSVGVFVSCVIGIQFGITYLILGLIINASILSVPAMILLSRRIGLHPWLYFRPCLVPAGAAALMGVAVWLIRISTPSEWPAAIQLIFQIVAGAVVYIATIFTFKRTLILNLWETMCHALGSGRQVSVAAIPPLTTFK